LADFARDSSCGAFSATFFSRLRFMWTSLGDRDSTAPRRATLGRSCRPMW